MIFHCAPTFGNLGISNIWQARHSLPSSDIESRIFVWFTFIVNFVSVHEIGEPVKIPNYTSPINPRWPGTTCVKKMIVTGRRAQDQGNTEIFLLIIHRAFVNFYPLLSSFVSALVPGLSPCSFSTVPLFYLNVDACSWWPSSIVCQAFRWQHSGCDLWSVIALSSLLRAYGELSLL